MTEFHDRANAMTREELDAKLKLAAALDAAQHRIDYLEGRCRDLAVERDDAITIKNNLCQQNTELMEDVAALILERDDALKEGMALAQEKDGLQILIESLRRDCDAVTIKLSALERGEYICAKCGIRKDGESQEADF